MVDTLSVIQTFWKEAEGVPKYINRMEAAQKKSTRTPLPVTDAVMHAIVSRALLASNEYMDYMREWQKLTPFKQTWVEWKLKFLSEYAAKELSYKARESVGQTFGGEANKQPPPLGRKGDVPITNQMVVTLAG